MALVLFPGGRLSWPLIDVWPMMIAETPNRMGFPWPPSGVAALRAVLRRAATHLGLHAHAEAQLLFAARGMMQVTTPQRPLARAAASRRLGAAAVGARGGHADRSGDAFAVHRARLARRSPRTAATGPRVRGRGGDVAARAGVGDVRGRRPIRGAADLCWRGWLCSNWPRPRMARPSCPCPPIRAPAASPSMVLTDPAGSRDLADLAREAGALATHDHPAVSAETDLTFKEWRQRARILASVEMLDGGRLLGWWRRGWGFPALPRSVTRSGRCGDHAGRVRQPAGEIRLNGLTTGAMTSWPKRVFSPATATSCSLRATGCASSSQARNQFAARSVASGSSGASRRQAPRRRLCRRPRAFWAIRHVPSHRNCRRPQQAGAPRGPPRRNRHRWPAPRYAGESAAS